MLNGQLPKLDFNGRFNLQKETCKSKIDFKGFVTQKIETIANKYILVKFNSGHLGVYSAKTFKEIKQIDFKNAKINCMTSNDHKIYMVVDNSYINVYQTSNFKHLDTIQIYGTLQHITLTEREDNLLSIYHCNNRTLAVVKIFGHSKMNRHQFEDYSY